MLKSFSRLGFPRGIFLSLQQVRTCQTWAWVLLELFWHRQQVVSMQPAKHTESSVKCRFSRGFVCFYSSLQWILKCSGNLAYFICLLGTMKFCCSMWKAAFHPTHKLSIPKKPRYWLGGAERSAHQSKSQQTWGFSSPLLLQRTLLLALVSTLRGLSWKDIFLAFLGIASLDGNTSGWQLCACYVWGKSPGFLKARCL